MSKKFGMKNLVGTMMALSAMTVGGTVSYAAPPGSATSSGVEDIELLGGELVKVPGGECVLGLSNARTIAAGRIDREILGPKDLTSVSKDRDLRNFILRLYRAAVRGCLVDCIGTREPGKDTRWFSSLRSAPNPDTHVKYDVMRDENAISLMREYFPKILKVAQDCVNVIKNEGKDYGARSGAAVVTAVETFRVLVDNLDDLLRHIPSTTEGALRLVIQRLFFADSLENSLLGRNFKLDAQSVEVRDYVKSGFDNIKRKWDMRTKALIAMLAKERKIDSYYLMYGRENNRQPKK